MKDGMTGPMNGLHECMKEKERKRDIQISLYRNK